MGIYSDLKSRVENEAKAQPLLNTRNNIHESVLASGNALIKAANDHIAFKATLAATAGADQADLDQADADFAATANDVKAAIDAESAANKALLTAFLDVLGYQPKP